jgi:hypothetical protein
MTCVWLLFLVVAFANGAFREFVLQSILGIHVHLAHQLSCLTGALLLMGTNLLIWSWLGISNRIQALWVGAAWFFATALFETFILNRKLSMEEIIQTYRLDQGEFWGLVLIWIGIMPSVIFIVKTRTTRILPKVLSPGQRRHPEP